MTVAALGAATVTWSDNTAANLLVAELGGPAGWTRYARSLGDTISRLDRLEPDLNTAIPGDPRDTTTPDATIPDLDAVLLRNALSDASRLRLMGWMLASTITGTLAAGRTAGRLARRGPVGCRRARHTHRCRDHPAEAGRADPRCGLLHRIDRAARDRLIAEVGRTIAETFATPPRQICAVPP